MIFPTSPPSPSSLPPLRLSVIIVNWNAWPELQRCLDSLQRYPAASQEILVVDNASSDGSAEKIARDFPAVRLLAEPLNHGFARANNLAYCVAAGENLLFLNPDTEVTPGALERLLSCSAGRHAVGPRLLDPDRAWQPSVRRFPTPRSLLFQYTLFRFWRPWKKPYRAYKMRDFSGREEVAVETVMGSALLVPRAALEKTGSFDERFFVYFEEVDLQKRLAEAGVSVHYCPEAKIVHHGGASTGQCRGRMMSVYLESLFRYARKHFPAPTLRWFCPAFKTALVLKLLLEIPEDLLHLFLYLLRRNDYLFERKKENAAMKARFLATGLPLLWRL